MCGHCRLKYRHRSHLIPSFLGISRKSHRQPTECLSLPRIDYSLFENNFTHFSSSPSPSCHPPPPSPSPSPSPPLSVRFVLWSRSGRQCCRTPTRVWSKHTRRWPCCKRERRKRSRQGTMGRLCEGRGRAECIIYKSSVQSTAQTCYFVILSFTVLFSLSLSYLFISSAVRTYHAA